MSKVWVVSRLLAGGDMEIDGVYSSKGSGAGGMQRAYIRRRRNGT